MATASLLSLDARNRFADFDRRHRPAGLCNGTRQFFRRRCGLRGFALTRAAQPEIVRQARKMVDTADRRIGTRTQNTLGDEFTPPESYRIQVLMEIYQKV